jgi:hypothetical protein
MIAASRLGNTQNPKWCFSETPFYPTLSASNELSSNTDPAAYIILQGFDATPIYRAFSNAVKHVACETLD